ncbi:hypothetical protein TNCV_2273381 [Trichonephila clavipes]|nr:hypothetical protein TNCV_2273381 [Trichonephila clavipes]
MEFVRKGIRIYFKCKYGSKSDSEITDFFESSPIAMMTFVGLDLNLSDRWHEQQQIVNRVTPKSRNRTFYCLPAQFTIGCP